MKPQPIVSTPLAQKSTTLLRNWVELNKMPLC